MRRALVDPGAGRSRRVRPALPRLHRASRRQRLPPLPAEDRPRRARRDDGLGESCLGEYCLGVGCRVGSGLCRGGAVDAGRRPGRALDRDDRLLPGPSRRVRRLVPSRRGRYARGPVHDQAWEAELDVATLWLDRPGLVGRDRRAGGRDRLVEPAPRIEGRAVDLRRRRDAARPGPRPVAGPPAAGAHPRPRCLARAGPGGRRAVLRVLAEPRAAGQAGRVPGPRSTLVEAGRHVRVRRLTARPAVRGRRPAADTRRPSPTSGSIGVGSPTAASSGS